MKKTTIIFALLIISTTAACSSKAGPFVTNISSNGAGGIVVEKCMVRLDRMINTVESADCTNTTIQIRK